MKRNTVTMLRGFSEVFEQKLVPAFTLAEVLITLGIIGVVAAMTLPSVISSYKQKEAVSRLKKFYSTMQQAIMLSEIDNAEVMYWNKEEEYKGDDSAENQLANAQASYNYFMTYIGPYLKYLSVDKAEEVEEGEEMKNYELRIIMLDGSIVYFHNGNCIDMTIDINGNKNPNKSGYDRFTFLLCKEPYQKSHCGNNKHWCSYIPVKAPTREKAFQMCKTTAAYCSTLLLYDNWEFKDDYPYKL